MLFASNGPTDPSPKSNEQEPQMNATQFARSPAMLADREPYRVITKIFGSLLGPEYIVSADGKTFRVYGAGFLAYQLRTTFRDLCRVIGFENARQEVAEIINAETERKRS
jgi:hypothetical protein